MKRFLSIIFLQSFLVGGVFLSHSEAAIYSNANDLCSRPASCNGLLCLNLLGLIDLGLVNEIEIPVLNQSISELQNVVLTYDTSAWLGASVLSDCGINGVSGSALSLGTAGSCGQQSNIDIDLNSTDLVNIGLFSYGYQFYPATPVNSMEQNSIYMRGTVTASLLSSNYLYGSYVKGADTYYGQIQPCTTSTPVLPDPLPQEDLCYADVQSDGNKCDMAGSFYYDIGPNTNHNCLTSQVIRNKDMNTTIDTVAVYKMYSPSITDGVCGVGGCSGPSALSILSGYGAGYTYAIGTLAPDSNVTISDQDTYYSDGTVNDIVLYGRYVKNGALYEGELPACPAGGGTIDINDFASQVDIVDAVVSATDPYKGVIHTKVSNKPNYQMTSVFLGDSNESQNANNTYGGYITANKTVDMYVVYYLSDATCTDTIRLMTVPGGNEPVVSIFQAGDSTATSNAFTMAYTDSLRAKRAARFKYKALDLSKLIIDANIDCPNSSTSGSASGTVTGIPACLTSTSAESTPAERYKEVFGELAFERCWEAIANGQPCNSSAIAANVPEPYNTQYGCLECSLGGIPYTCSSDAFAIRPDHYAISTVDPHYPDLLRSGSDHNMTVYALNYGINVATLDYNQTGGAGGNIDLNQSMYLHTGVFDTAGLLHGTLQWSTWDFDMQNGVSYYPATGATEVAGVTFNDVGRVVIGVQDHEWASVDILNLDDNTSEDCSPDGAYICGDQNVTYIPHHFDFNETNVTNNNGLPGSFTYLANLNEANTSTYVMAARVDTLVAAKNALGGVTQNFRDGAEYYENKVWLVQAVHDALHGDANVTKIGDPTVDGVMLGFGKDGDENGTKSITWDETNLSQVLRFNFPRQKNAPVNPFIIDGPDYNVSIVSHYTQTPPSPSYDSEAFPRGDRNATADGKVLFIYGRAHSPRFRVPCDVAGAAPCSTEVAKPVKVYYEFYYYVPGSYSIDANNTLPISTYLTALTNDNQRSSDAIKWYINTLHTPTDGNITTTAPAVGTLVNDGTYTNVNGMTLIPYTYNGNEGYPYKATIRVNPYNGSSSWLIYNKYNANATHNEFELEFNNKSGAKTGTDAAGAAVDSDANTNTNRRIQW